MKTFIQKNFVAGMNESIIDSFKYEKIVGSTTENGELISWQWIASMYAEELIWSSKIFDELLKTIDNIDSVLKESEKSICKLTGTNDLTIEEKKDLALSTINSLQNILKDFTTNE